VTIQHYKFSALQRNNMQCRQHAVKVADVGAKQHRSNKAYNSNASNSFSD